MKTAQRSLTILTGLVISSSVSLGADQTRVLSEPQLERPTLHSLGVYWIVARRRQPQCLGSPGIPQGGYVELAARVHRWFEWNGEPI